MFRYAKLSAIALLTLTVGQLKTFPLKPGAHDIELRDPHGQSFYQEHIDVIAGKTIRITP